MQVKKHELESNLAHKDAEIRQLKAQLENGSHHEAEQSPEQRRKAEEQKLKDCQAAVASHIKELQTFLEKHDLEDVNPTGRAPHCSRSILVSGCNAAMQVMIKVICIGVLTLETLHLHALFSFHFGLSPLKTNLTAADWC